MSSRGVWHSCDGEHGGRRAPQMRGLDSAGHDRTAANPRATALAIDATPSELCPHSRRRGRVPTAPPPLVNTLCRHNWFTNPISTQPNATSTQNAAYSSNMSKQGPRRHGAAVGRGCTGSQRLRRCQREPCCRRLRRPFLGKVTGRGICTAGHMRERPCRLHRNTPMKVGSVDVEAFSRNLARLIEQGGTGARRLHEAARAGPRQSRV